MWQPGPPGPPRSSGPNGLVIALVLVCCLAVVGLLGFAGLRVYRAVTAGSDPIAASKSSSGDSTSSDDSTDSDSSDSDSDSSESEPSPTPTSPWTDDGYEAEVGECFNDSGTQTSPNLTLNTACSPGSYKVVQRITATTDRDRCGGEQNHTNWSVTYDDPSGSSQDLVLCLSYQYNAAAGSAIVGECVYGTPGPTSSWRMSTCEPGAFKVIAKHYGTLSYDKCRSRGDYRMGVAYANSARPALNVVICTKYLYNDDAAYAKKNNCVRVKQEGNSWWMYFSDCDSANAIVTGHTGKYQPSFCRNDGWVGHKHPNREWNHLDYTVCWRRYP